MNTAVIEPQFKAPAVEDELKLTEYQRWIAIGLSIKQMGHEASSRHSPIYQGYGADIIHLPRPPHGPGEVGRLEGFSQPDPRIARVTKRRVKNRAARKARRINRIAGAR